MTQKISQSKAIVTVVSVAVLFVGLSYCSARIFHGASIEGQVIDANTRQPIGGVVVVAEWRTQNVGVDTGFLHLAEAVTDSAGHYHIDGWGPKVLLYGYLEPTAPTLYLLKRGYGFHRVGNEFRPLWPEDPIQSEWDKKTLEMKLFSGSAKDYAWEMDGYDEAYSQVAAPCAWADIPRFTAEAVMLNDQFLKMGIDSSFPSLDQLRYMRGKRTGKCPDPGAVLKDYLK